MSEFAKFFNFVCRIAFFAPRYNIAPRQQVPVIVLDQFQPTLKLMRWGLIPSWAPDESIGDKLINARAETIFEKPSFRKPMQRQRCLIPADGFYEWQADQGRGSRGEGRAPKPKTSGFAPFRFTMRDHSIFCFAGIYEQ